MLLLLSPAARCELADFVVSSELMWSPLVYVFLPVFDNFVPILQNSCLVPHVAQWFPFATVIIIVIIITIIVSYIYKSKLKL